MTLPEHGDLGWDTPLNNAVQAISADAAAAKADALAARNDAAYAKQAVDTVGIDDLASALSDAETAADTATTNASVATGAASSAQSYATQASTARSAAEDARDAAEAARTDLLSQKGAASGVAPLDSGSRVPQGNLPAHLDPTALTASTAVSDIVRKYGKPDASRAFLQSELERINLAGGRVGIPGDSLTEGNANGGHPWYEEWEALYPNITFVNYGHGGKTTKDFIDTYLTGILADTPCDMYVVALGCNDVRYKNRTDGTQGATTAAAFATNLTTIVNTLSPVGSVVVVNPWMTTVKDYAQDITTAAKEKAFAEYDAAAQAAVTALGVPYIQTNGLMVDSYRDAARALSWSDGVHPTAAYVKQYARLVLLGRAPRGEVLPLPIKATKAFLYRLEILGKVPTTTDAFERVYLRSLLQDPATVGESYSTGNRDTFADSSVLFATYDNTKALVNLEGDWPLHIMWSRDVRLQYLVQLPNGMARGIGDYRLWESSDPEAIGQPDHPSWRLLFNGRRGRANGKGAQRLLYAARRNEERYFYKWVLSSAYSSDTSIKVTSLSFPSNTGADGLSAYRTSAAQSEDQVQMFNQNSISTDFGTSGWIIGAFNSSVPTFNIAFGATNRADGWSLYQSSDPAAFDDESHASWKKIRSGAFGGSASPGNVSTRADGVRFPAYATGSRPSAASVEAGAGIFDTTLGKPAFSDGTAWQEYVSTGFSGTTAAAASDSSVPASRSLVITTALSGGTSVGGDVIAGDGSTAVQNLIIPRLRNQRRQQRVAERSRSRAMTRVALPAAMAGWNLIGGFALFFDGGRYRTFYDASARKNSGGTTRYMNSVTGNDTTGDGSSGAPYQTLGKAYGMSSDGDTIVVQDTGIVYREYAYAGGTLSKSINIIAANSAAPPTFVSASALTWTAHATYAGVWQATRSNVSRFIDLGPDPLGHRYTLVADVATVATTPGSYYTDGTTLYVHTLTAQQPSNTQHLALLTGVNLFTIGLGSRTSDMNIYLEGIRVLNGSTGVVATGSNSYALHVTAKSCGFAHGHLSTANGFEMVDCATVVTQGCTVAYTGKDGFNYHSEGRTSAPTQFLEIDDVAHSCGLDRGTDYTMNATTCHVGVLGVRVGGRYYYTNGTPVADVGVSGPCTANYSCEAWGSTAPDGSTFQGCFSPQQAGTEMWLFDCRGWGTSYDLYCPSGSTLHVDALTEWDTRSAAGTWDLSRPQHALA